MRGRAHTHTYSQLLALYLSRALARARPCTRTQALSLSLTEETPCRGEHVCAMNSKKPKGIPGWRREGTVEGQEKKLFATTKFPVCFGTKVDMRKVRQKCLTGLF